jgi:hypothetical protein
MVLNIGVYALAIPNLLSVFWVPLLFRVDLCVKFLVFLLRIPGVCRVYTSYIVPGDMAFYQSGH